MDRYLLAKTRQYVEAVDPPAGRLRGGQRLRHHAGVPRRALELVHPPFPRALLGRRRRPSTTDAFDTLFTVLETVCRVAAPLLPLTTEEVWRGLTGERSVHLTDWPSADDLPADDELVEAMDQVRDVCSAGSALRKGASLRNRLPLSTLTVVVAGADRLTGFEEIVADELNVKSVRLLDADHPDAASYGVSQRLTVNARAAGPRLGKDVQTAIKGSKSGDWSVSDDGEVTAGGLVLQDGEFTLETVAVGRRRLRDRDAARAAGSSCSTRR